MKLLKLTVVMALIASYLAAPAALFAADAKDEKKDKKLKPFPLEKCLVSDEDFGGDMGEPYVFEHEGREVKLCCKSCIKEFKKETKKYVKKMEDAEKKKAKDKK